MENMIFSVVLFVVYFCFASYFLYSPSNTDAEPVEPIEKQIQRMFQEIDSVSEDSENEVLRAHGHIKLPRKPRQSCPQQEQTLVSTVDLEQLRS
jgi:hypothetical protein